MVEQKDQKSIAIDIKRTIPVFADNVIVANVMKSYNGEKKGKRKGKRGKEGQVTLIFVDNLSRSAIARIVLSKSTAESLEKALGESLEKFDKELKGEEKKKIEAPVAEKGKARYLG